MILKKGIVIKSLKYKETSKIIYILNDEGLESLLVKGATNIKSKNFSYTQEITKVGFDIAKSKNNSFNIITTGEVINNYSNIKNDFYKMNDAFSVLEYAYQFSEHIEDYKIFYNFLSFILDCINEGNSRYYPLIFKLKLLYLLGIGPIFNNCIICGNRSDLIGFSFDNGGMICTKCFITNQILYRKDSLNTIRILYLTKPDNINDDLLNLLPDHLDEINLFINSYYLKYLGFESKVNRVLNKMKI